jgi:hypothetical protein
MGIKRAFFHTSLGRNGIGTAHRENNAFNRHSGALLQSRFAFFNFARQ